MLANQSQLQFQEMARWILVLCATSFFLGLCQGYGICEADGRAHCVKSDNCKINFTYRSNGQATGLSNGQATGLSNGPASGCPHGTICCKDEDIACGPYGKHNCIRQDLCKNPEVNPKELKECPNNYICCKPVEKTILSTYEKL
ncbi:uncharacterized protein LOC108091932 [Drosophila ficusphila]|uniref:uncharacterized protein LOC108091932 n=1 Tax=Drosophila ficusphila TaxID=30025 RepID=UPI0007E82602|nr:uncharacterized protein LOC108091932 [Drosophila ficusphila]